MSRVSGSDSRLSDAAVPWLQTVSLLTVFVAVLSIDLGAVSTMANAPALSSSGWLTYLSIGVATFGATVRVNFK